MGRELPPEAREAFYIVEAGCAPTFDELDTMPQRSIELLISYKAVKDTILNGGTMLL